MRTSNPAGNFGPISTGFPRILHGADYNPEQWKNYPGIWDEDFRLMELAGCNVMSVGIFSWAAIEPEEGTFTFSWLDEIFGRFGKAGMGIVLATPSGAKPAWMAQRYPEILRVNADRERNFQGQRHNHCPSSPVYREKCRIINRKLAERYGTRSELILWHVSNEYGGDCHCPLCQDAFREWLKKRYKDLDTLNHAWWTDFWSHRFTDWAQIESPCPRGENQIHGHNIDWNRFVTDQTIDFFKTESQPLREISPSVPVTVNMMGTYPPLDYWKFAPHLDVVSWDNYPTWGNASNEIWETAANTAFVHDIYRRLKQGRPWILMESTPSLVNWQTVNKLKPEGLHPATSLQAVAHGADSVQYFQWRKSRGGPEKFHGAVVDHDGSENTRVFREVKTVGTMLARLDAVAGSSSTNRVALVYDWENRWAIDDLKGLRTQNRDYEQTAQSYYKFFWKNGIGVDVINADESFEGYSIVVAPMLYQVRAGVAQRLEDFVENGGVLVTTFLTGYADESDLCFLGGFPGGKDSPLRRSSGIWAEEIDSLWDGESGTVLPLSGSGIRAAGGKKAFTFKHFCELIHSEGAEVLAVYGSSWYRDRPACTRNSHGSGFHYHVGAKVDDALIEEILADALRKNPVSPALESGEKIPLGVSIVRRDNERGSYVFAINFSEHAQTVALGPHRWTDLLSGTVHTRKLTLERFGVSVLTRQ